MRFLRKFVGVPLLTVAILFFGFLTANIVCRAQPTQNVRIELKESHDKNGQRCVDVFITNLTDGPLIFGEELGWDFCDVYGGMWEVKSDDRIGLMHCYRMRWLIDDLEDLKKGRQWDCKLRMPSDVDVYPNQTKKISSFYVFANSDSATVNAPIQVSYQPGKELERYVSKPLLLSEYFDRVLARAPIHHVLLSRKIYWSNKLNVKAVQKSDIPGVAPKDIDRVLNRLYIF